MNLNRFKRQLAQVLLLLLGSATIFSKALAAPSQIIEQVRDSDTLIRQPWVHILVVTVTSMEPGPNSNAQPPRGRVVVDQVLKGHSFGREISIIWEPIPSKFPATSEWKTRQIPAPSVGEKLIVAGQHSDFLRPDPTGALKWEMPRFEVRQTYRFSQNNVETILANKGPTDRHPIPQLISFFGAITLCGLSLLRAFTPSRTGKRMRRAWLLYAFALGGYAFYESGTLSANIRVDLLLVFPILVATPIILLIAFLFLPVDADT
jgi:hypothetical protein